MAKLTIVTYFDPPEILGYPLNLTQYFHSYQWFAEYCANQGADMIICRGDSYLGSMRFTEGHRFNGEFMEKVEGPITASVILRKGLNLYGKTDEQDKIVNVEEFDHFAGDKWRMYEQFAEFMASTHPLTEEGWQETFKKISTKKVVLKPVRGTGGNGIVIADKENIDLPDFIFKEPYLIQEFVDTSAGIPGITDGLHDLRFINFNGKLGEWAYLRIPKPGSLLSNIAKGATAKPAESAKVPDFVHHIIQEVDRRLSHYPYRFYSLDFLIEGNRAVLGEINPQPGFPHLYNEGKDFCDMFYRQLFDLLKERAEA